MSESDKIEHAWNEYRSKLLHYISAQVASPADAEDILSLAFTKLITHEKTKGMPDNVVPWLYRVVKNTIIDYYRGRKELDEISEDAIDSQEPSGDAIKSLSSCVQPMIALLPEPYRTTLFFADIELMDHKHIAEITGKSLPATKAEVRRARSQLQEVIADCCQVKVSESRNKVLDIEPQATTCCKKCDP